MDHIYTGIDPEITHANVLKYGLSDHDLTYLIIKKNSLKPQRESFRCRDFTNYSTDDLKYRLNDLDWNPLYETDDVNTCWLIIYNNFINVLHELAPFRSLTNVKECKHWATPELLSLARRRDCLKGNADTFSENAAYIKYKELKNRVKNETC